MTDSILLFEIRADVECDLAFLGLLVLENRLKDETKPVILQLKRAKIRTIMVTGMLSDKFVVTCDSTLIESTSDNEVSLLRSWHRSGLSLFFFLISDIYYLFRKLL